MIKKTCSKIVKICVRRFILGIETSCDDTGVAVVNSSDGNLISEAIENQTYITSRVNGVIPLVAKLLHESNLNNCVKKVLSDAGVNYQDLSAIAVTLKPGMPLSLGVGRDFAVAKAKDYKLPIIPIHHMEAHALTIRMLDKSVQFPFMFLLVSGGNSLLGVAQDIDEFLLLGDRLDVSPGVCLDKIARILNLTGNYGTMNDYSGGKAIELMAAQNKDNLLNFNIDNTQNCNFKFDVVKIKVSDYIHANPSALKHELPKICASVLASISSHLCARVLRAMSYCNHYMDNTPSTLVVAGGVASNSFIRKSLEIACHEYDYSLKAPPPKYCTDNGAMIAWNGYELFRRNLRIVKDLDTIDYSGRAQFGTDISSDVTKIGIKTPKLKINHLFIQNM